MYIFLPLSKISAKKKHRHMGGDCRHNLEKYFSCLGTLRAHAVKITLAQLVLDSSINKCVKLIRTVENSKPKNK